MKNETKNQILRHLAWYKESVLGISENGTWQGTKYPHILPESAQNKNLIDAGFYSELHESLISLQNNSGKAHWGFAHLNSSQALALNLFVPLSAASRLDVVLDQLSESTSTLRGTLEYVDDEVEGTTFDYCVHGEVERYFFEVKYTEDSFAAAKDDASHRAKFERVYERRVADIADISRDEFFRDYQLWRNIIYTDRAVVTFVVPRFRTDLQEVVKRALDRVKFPDRVKLLTVDDLVQRAVDIGDSTLERHFQEFRRKYLSIGS